MGLPTPPVALSANYLTVLQARPATPAPVAPEPAQAEPKRPSLTSHAGRGRLVDILV